VAEAEAVELGAGFDAFGDNDEAEGVAVAKIPDRLRRTRLT